MRMFIKPFSVNGAWKGRRRRTDRYNSYEELLLFTLPNFKIPKGRLSIEFEFGFKNKSSDVDNPIKPFLDILQKKYGFNDNMVYRIVGLIAAQIGIGALCHPDHQPFADQAEQAVNHIKPGQR